MHLRNFEGAAREAHLDRPSAARSAAKDLITKQDTAAPATGSRGAFFEMMLTAQPAEPPAVKPPAAKPPSADENSSSTRGAKAAVPRQTAVQTPAAAASTVPESKDAGAPVPTDPVAVLNSLLGKLGYDPSTFNTRVTSQHIAVPGLAYDYPLLEVTVNGERVGFHLPSAANDLRMTAANISSMMGNPVMSLGVFA